ncbi:MAG TPA: DNA/RNA non-specific endonuclease, partial [Puia sp.]|nr:DNA/RNA non-specific endonuclease [Puia sp.]
TGFLVSPDLILTNHHVFQGKDLFKDALIDFDYAYDAGGQEMTKIVFQISPEKFFYTYQDLDFTLVGIEPKDQTGTHTINERGYLILNPNTGKAGVGDAATIIQYPDGNYQQVGLRENQILDLSDPNNMIYQTDTSPGTSGSPVFNDQWQVIALHSAGVAKKDAAGNYVDNSGKPIPVVDGKVDSTRIVWVSNSGIRVSAMMKQITGDATIKNDPKIQFLLSPAYSDAKNMVNISVPKPNEVITIPDLNIPITNTNDYDMTPSVNIPNNTGTIIINVNGAGPGYPSVKMQQGLVQADANADESKKITTDQDFKNCKGFQAKGFLSFETPIPSLSKKLLRQAVPLTDNPKSNILDYFYYSTIQHAIRKMPIVSAINVEGNVADRKDSSKRVDRWLQDNRIDPDAQLSDAYYSKSGFDKGHMSRREDADYGAKAADALQAANMTCMYTNACPQVPKLNRAPGLWGDLEKIILEQGVKKEAGVESKICVYNGPIFLDSDPVYQSVQVPMRF